MYMVKIMTLGFNPVKMGLTNTYPNSLQEIEDIMQAMKNPDWEYFKLTDHSPKPAFQQYLSLNNLPVEDQSMQNIINQSYPVIIALKQYHNRPRPYQISNIKPAQSTTANTPAHPSGHALQSYLISDMLSAKYPERKRDFKNIADRIANARVSVGLHYPSDNDYAKRLSKELSNY